jgi:TRAP-type C4-dicarboxylate transport system permease small subunit
MVIDIMKEEIKKIINPSLVGLKIIVFFCLLIVGCVMYVINRPMIGNDILIVMALFVIFNKLDNLEK